MNVKSEDSPNYLLSKEEYTAKVEDEAINFALKILEGRLTKPDFYITNPNDTYTFMKLKLSESHCEVFAVIFLDNRHGIIKYEEMFNGTIDGASVYPREVIKRALELNAAALILTHNHPSGNTEPSKADENITIRIKEACQLVDIRLLDHIIIGGTSHTSLAERGII